MRIWTNLYAWSEKYAGRKERNSSTFSMLHPFLLCIRGSSKFSQMSPLSKHKSDICVSLISTRVLILSNAISTVKIQNIKSLVVSSSNLHFNVHFLALMIKEFKNTVQMQILRMQGCLRKPGCLCLSYWPRVLNANKTYK